MCSSRKYPYPHHGGNWTFQGGGGVKGPGNSGGEGGLEAKFTIDSLHTLDCATYMYQLSWDVPKFKVVKLRYF